MGIFLKPFSDPNAQPGLRITILEQECFQVLFPLPWPEHLASVFLAPHFSTLQQIRTSPKGHSKGLARSLEAILCEYWSRESGKQTGREDGLGGHSRRWLRRTSIVRSLMSWAGDLKCRIGATDQPDNQADFRFHEEDLSNRAFPK